MYEHGEGVARDLKATVSWYRKSADQQNPSGLKHLGLMYKSAQGVGKDLKTAAPLFQKAAASD